MQRLGSEAARERQQDLARSDRAGNLVGRSFCLCHRDHPAQTPRGSLSLAGPERCHQVDGGRAGHLHRTDDRVSCAWEASRSEEMRSRHDVMSRGGLAELVDGKTRRPDARVEDDNGDGKLVGD